MKVVRIGTRDSVLALAQTYMVRDAILAADPTITVEIIAMKTRGDKILNVTLDKVGGKGLFVKELDDALLNNQVDLTVHSYKDMPMDVSDRLPVVAVSDREDPRDVLLMRQGCEFTPDSVIGSSSFRRSVQLASMGYHHVVSVRGNVQTRLRKRDEGVCDGLILAAAGVLRLNLGHLITETFSLEKVIPSPCQGVIAVQARAGEDVSFLNAFHNEEAAITSQAERGFSSALGGSCSVPLAAYATIEEGDVVLRGMYKAEGGTMQTASIRGNACDARALGCELASRIKEMC